MRKIALVAIVLLGVVVPQHATAACGYARMSVSGSAEETADACRALEQVVSYFRKIGFEPQPSLAIAFRDRVEIDVYLQDYARRSERPAGRNEVSGYYDFRRNELQITSGRRDVARERKPWGIPWGQPIAYSILQHELVHAIVAGLLGGRYQKLGKAWHEFIAYAVQFDVMDAALRRQVIANYPDAEPFQFPESVNAIVYAVDPDAFGVAAHLYAQANGGTAFVRRILLGDVPFTTDEFEFLWTE